MGTRSNGGYKDPLNELAAEEARRQPKPRPPKLLIVKKLFRCKRRRRRKGKMKWRSKR